MKSRRRSSSRGSSRDRKQRRRRSSSSSEDRHRRRKRSNDRKRSRSPRDKQRKKKQEKDVFEFSDAEDSKRSEIKSRTDLKDAEIDKEEEPAIEKELPCYEPSGILAEYSNKTSSGVVLKFTEPLDAAMPDKQWRLYVYKGEEELQPVNLSKQTCYLLGRDSRVADIVLENPSCSMQHAVIQFRERQRTRELSQEEQTARGIFQGFINEAIVLPFLMDLESSNRTILNGKEIEPARYYELREEDVLRFGQSERDYVLMRK